MSHAIGHRLTRLEQWRPPGARRLPTQAAMDDARAFCWHCASNQGRARLRMAHRGEVPKVVEATNLAQKQRCSTMAWKQRGAHWYYYRNVRHGRQVTKAYLGTGSLAEWQAAEDAAEQEAQRIKADAWRQTRTSLSPRWIESRPPWYSRIELTSASWNDS